MQIDLAPKVLGALNALDGLSDEERRQFYWAAQNTTRLGRAPAPAASDPPPETDRPDPWEAFTLADAYQERPPLTYIAGQLFALPSLNIVYGPPGSLKSFLLADLAVCAASGQDWLAPAPWLSGNGHHPAGGLATRQCPVMWLDFDNGRRRTHDRFSALGRARRLPAGIPLTYYSMPSPWLDANNKASVGELSQRIQRQAARLVIIDNLGVVSGDADENSGDMVVVMSLLRQLTEETGAAITLIHHQRKSSGFTSRVGDSLRGHSSIEAALDLALLVEREELSDTVALKATKARGADVLPFSAVFTYETRPGGELATARFFGASAEDTHSGSAIEREILAALQSGPLNKTDLAKTVKGALPNVGFNRIRDMIDRLSVTGKLNISSGRTNTEKVYSRG